MTEQLWIDERLAQSVLRMLSQGKSLTTEEVASGIGLDNVQALVLLRDTMRGRVVDVTDFADRAANRRTWVAGETPLPPEKDSP